MKPKIVVDGLDFFYGPKHVLWGISLEMPPNSVTAFIGASGCGKSTFLRCLNRMNETLPKVRTRIQGRVLLDGRNIYDPGMDPIGVRTRVGMVFQKSTLFPKSIFENVAYGLRIHRLTNSKKELADRVEHSLRQAFLWDEVKDRLHQSALNLSGGQQQRLCIARALVTKPSVLLLDESTASLDPRSTAQIEHLIRRLKADHTIAIVTHNTQQAARLSDSTAFFYDGILIEMNTTREIFENPACPLTEEFISVKFKLAAK